MADRYPLIINPSANQLQEIASGDNLALNGCDISNIDNINSLGVITATKFVGPMEGVVTGSISGTAGGLSGTPNIAVGNINAATANFTGNVSIAGTLTYEDVTSVDSVGLVTARNGFTVLNGTSTFNGPIDANVGLDVDGQTDLDNVNVSGVITATTIKGDADGLRTLGTGVTITAAGVVSATTYYATTYYGSGANLTGIDATALKDAAGNVKIQANPSGAIHTGVSTVGIITGATSVGATRFYGDGSKLTGIDATTIQTGNTSVQTVDTGSDGHIKFITDGTERVRIKDESSLGQVGVNTSALNAGVLSLYGPSHGEGTALGQIECKANTSHVYTPTGGIIFSGHHDWPSTAIFAGVRGFKANTTQGDYDGCLGFDVRKHGAVPYEAMRINEDGDVLPGTDNTQDFGSSAKRWANVYTGDLHLSNEGRGNDVDGTSGAWTMQEGSDDLFLINNKTGKKYKFNLTEVS